MTNEDREEVRQIVQSVLQQEGVAIDDNTVFPMKDSAGQDDALLMMQLNQQHQATEYSRIEAEKVGGGGKPITIDQQPTKDSPNAVSSGGTYNGLLNANARIESLNIQVGALLTKNMLDVRNNWSGAVGGEVEYSEDIPDTITAFDQLYSPVIRIGYGVPMCYSFYSDEEIGDSVIAFYGTDEPENARDYSDMSRPHTVLQFTRLDNDTYNDNTQKYRYFVVITSPFDGYLVLEHSKNNDNYTVICPMLEAGRTPTEYSADMTAYINAHLTPTQRVNAQNNMMGKAYAPAQFSGLGKKVLSKNTQTVGGIQKNVMTQAFFQDSQGNELTNTVFVIQYDYELDEDVTIGVGCRLLFDGGYIGGSHTITGNHTSIEAGLNKIFGKEVNIAGTWNVSEAYSEWFNGNSDVDNINKALQSFRNVRLLDKHYLVDKVDNDGIAITMPEGSILKGSKCVENTSGATSIITVDAGLQCESVILMSKCCLLTDISVRGNGSSTTNSCVSTRATSRCTLNRVSASSSYYGFNLQIFLSSIIQCTASYNQIGFYIHGKVDGEPVHYTSLNITGCYAVDSRINGYFLDHIVYSTMSNCAADGCGAPNTGVIDANTDIYAAYKFNTVQGFTLNSCGLEKCLKAIYMNMCQNFIVNTPNFFFTNNEETTLDASFVFKDIFDIHYSVSVQFNYPRLSYYGVTWAANSNLLKIYTSGTACKSVIYNATNINDIQVSNIYVEGGLTKEDLLIYNIPTVLPASFDVSRIPDIIDTCEKYRYGYKVVDLPFKITSDFVAYSNTISYNGNVIVNGDSKRVELAGGLALKANIVFDTVTIAMHNSYASPTSVFEIEGNRKVVFKNCTFIVNTEPSEYYFNVKDNSQLEFIDCLVYWVGDNKERFCNIMPSYKCDLVQLYSIATTTAIAFTFADYYVDSLVVAKGTKDFKHVYPIIPNIGASATMPYLDTGMWAPCEVSTDDGKKYLVIEKNIIPHRGSTSQRPTSTLNSIGSAVIGFEYFDETISKPIYWTSTGWVDAIGTVV